MIMMAAAIITCAGRVRVRAGVVTGQGHRERSTGQCAAGYGAVSESECEDIAKAVGRYSWGGACCAGGVSGKDAPPGCIWLSFRFGLSVFYNKIGVDGGGNDCSVLKTSGCICACVSGRYSSSTTPADGECTACDSGKRFSTSVL